MGHYFVLLKQSIYSHTNTDTHKKRFKKNRFSIESQPSES